MKRMATIFLGLSLMSAIISWEIDSNQKSIMPVAAAAPNRVSNGQIIQISGEVQLKRWNGRVIRPTTGTRVYPGDQLLAVNGAQVLVQCAADLKTWSAKAGEKSLNRCPEAAEQAECTPGTYKCPHRGDVIAWLEGIPYIISPRRTAILNDKPTLHWNAVPGATSYTVSVEGVSAEGELLENRTKEVRGTRIDYLDKQPLKPGVSYLVMVEANTGASSLDEPVRPGGLRFSLLDADKAQSVQAEAQQISQQEWTDEAKALALAHLYTKNGLIADAITTLEKLVGSGVQTAPIYNTLGELYLNYLALVPQARDYFLKSAELAAPEDTEERTAAQDGLGQVQAALGKKDEACRWLNLAVDGYRDLKDSQRASALENQLRELACEGK